MAKVYSWAVDKTGSKYAYIVHPNDFTRAYVGNELKGTNLQKVKEWASTCTDEEYIEQFEKMKELCTSKNISVSFEVAASYMDVESTCDNLRGPAGRGIKRIALTSEDAVTRISTYTIFYDDDTTSTFSIQNGLDGRNGIDGTPGAKGDTGVSSKFMMVYASGKDSEGNLITPTRPGPNEGGYDFIGNVATYPAGWEPSDGNVVPPVWMCSRTFTSTDATTDPQWTVPVQITGENGAPGVDGLSTEFIYKLTDVEPSQEEVASLPSENVNGYVPDESWGWTASPLGVDEDHRTEWCCIRKMDREANAWGPWTGPSIWSKYGVNGQDGDGVQYIYLRNTGAWPLNPTPAGYNDSSSTIYEEFQNKDTEWVPAEDTSYINCYGSAVTLTNSGTSESPAGIWTDNPTDVSVDYQFVWVSSRKYRKPTPDSKTKEWTKFSDPTLWAKFGEDGKNATSIRKLYALATTTGNPPDVPADSNFTSDWGTGFPKDYDSNLHVVWGTEAEIWAHNYEFVMSYKTASIRDGEGNVVPPADASGNSREVPYLPNEEDKAYKYLIYNGDYYSWQGGWCTPYLVTGMKGDNGQPIDYATYVFAYGWIDGVPAAPLSGVSASTPGTSKDERNRTVTWLDFPDTTGGRVDGVVDENGIERRWYQCTGQVDGRLGTVKSWGQVSPCNGRDGEALPGKYTETRFGVTPNTNKPRLVQLDAQGNVLREPTLDGPEGVPWGWFTTDEELPDIPGADQTQDGGAMWQIWALIDGATDQVIGEWNGPKKVSGERGKEGPIGPTGMRGVTGIPGASSHHYYCLGTYGKNTNSESFWESGDGYFGGEEWRDLEGCSYGSAPSALTGWYSSKELPFSDILNAESDGDLNTFVLDSANKGRVVRRIRMTEETVNGSTFYNTTHQYYLINNDNTCRSLTEELSEAESEEFNVYVWCIQGTDVWQSGTVAEGTPGDQVEHTLLGVDWSSPFKMQGTNGIRGIAGGRGQVIYPMGVYNHEEVYVTTEQKAPYVYDPNDGLFYVYNIVDRPWVGMLPSNFQNVIIHPDDITNNYEDTVIDPETLTYEQNPDKKYLRYNNMYYIWKETSDDSGVYVMASRYKYSSNGSGAPGTWIGDQNGDTPANNFANASLKNTAPAWVRFESFEALYTTIGIIENGMVGSAVYNNEFMFSQQGIDRNGNKTNYAVVSGKDTSYGFLSGYRYDNDGDSLGRHWYYAGTEQFINDSDVNPYERKNESNKNYILDSNVKDGDYIHTFMPNVCINFSTGQMWASCGKNHFDSDGTGYLADKAIKWWFTENNVGVQIGKDGQNGIKFADDELTVGPLETYKGEMDTALQNMNNQITSSTETLRNALEQYRDELQEQVDKRADTYYQSTDPSRGSVTGGQWQTSNSANTATYAPNRVGDLWYDTSVGKSYVYASSSNGVEGFKRAEYPTNVEYFWVESNVPESVYNAISTRSKIFTDEPYIPYYAGDLWFVHSNDYMDSAFYGNSTGISSGTCVVCLTTNTDTESTFSTEHWGRRDRYADEAQLAAAQEELANMANQLRSWADDNLLSPTELKLLEEEYQTIRNEYSTITGQAETLKLTGTTEYTDYTNAYSKVVKITDEYYLKSENATAKTNGVGAIVSGGDCVVIVTGETETYWYGWYETYYTKRQLLLQAISNKLNSNISEGIVNAVTSANTYTDGQISGVTSNITALSGVIQMQLDAKLDTWKQAADPAISWTTDEVCTTHLGDIWYNPSDGCTWSFTNKYRTGMSNVMAKRAATAANAPVVKYWWVRSDMSLLLFDYNDGKSSVFYNVNPTGYAQNDMWMVPTGQTEFDSYGVGDIVVCNRVPALSGTNDAGSVIATGFTAGDWVKLNNYTDDTYAETMFAEWAKDGYLSPPERKALKDEADAIMSESGNTYSQAVQYLGPSASTTTTADYVNAAKYAYNTAMYYYNGVDTSITQTIKITGATSTGNYASYYGNIKNYYTVRQATQNAIMNKINDNAANASNDTAFLKDVFDSITNNKGATVSSYLGVTNTGNTVNQIVAYLDGSGLATHPDNKNNKIIFASGIPTGTTALSARTASAKTKIYSDGTFETKQGIFNGKLKSDICSLGYLLINKDIFSFYSANKKSNVFITTDNGDTSPDGFGFTSTKGGVRYMYTLGDMGPMTAATINTTGIGENATAGRMDYNLPMPFHRGAEFAMVNSGYAFERGAGKKYFTPTYCALRVTCDVGSSTYDNYAIASPVGMYGGLRPCIVTITASTYTADIFDHTIIMNSTFGQGGEKTVTIPQNPPKGQEYVIMCPHRYSGTAAKASKFHITISGGGSYKCINDGAVRSNTITFTEANVECRLWWDGTYWWYAYNSWEK